MRALLISLFAAATASAQAASTASKAAAPTHVASDTAKLGTYDLEITMEDGTMLGSLALSRTGPAYTAVLVAGGNRPAVHSFVRDGKGYVLTVGHDDFTIVYTLAFANDSLKGSFKVTGGTTGTVAGARKP